MTTTYRIQERIAGSDLWQSEPSGDTFATREEAESAIEGLEPTNDDGAALEYRVVEA